MLQLLLYTLQFTENYDQQPEQYLIKDFYFSAWMIKQKNIKQHENNTQSFFIRIVSILIVRRTNFN